MHGFAERIEVMVQGGMKGHDLVNEVLKEWESSITRVSVISFDRFVEINLSVIATELNSKNLAIYTKSTSKEYSRSIHFESPNKYKKHKCKTGY